MAVKRVWKLLGALVALIVGGGAIFIGGALHMMSYEGATVGALIELRDALATHRTQQGKSPLSLDELKRTIPEMHIREHPASTKVRYGTVSDDTGGWLYDNVPGDPFFGQVWLNCTHPARKSLGPGQAPASHTGWDSI